MRSDGGVVGDYVGFYVVSLGSFFSSVLDGSDNLVVVLGSVSHLVKSYSLVDGLESRLDSGVVDDLLSRGVDNSNSSSITVLSGVDLSLSNNSFGSSSV